MKLDSQLVVVLLSVCPISDLKILFRRIPCHIAVAWLANMDRQVQVCFCALDELFVTIIVNCVICSLSR